MKYLSALVLALMVMAPTCENTCDTVKGIPDYETPTRLAMGDSIFVVGDGNCTTIPDKTSLEIGSYVLNKAVSGCRLSNSTKPDIRSQYVPGQWNRIVVDGGANDLALECSTNPVLGKTCDQTEKCVAIVNELATEMQEFVNRMKADGVERIVVLGYYHMKTGAMNRYDLCNPYYDSLNSKYQALKGSVYMPTSDLMDPILYPIRYTQDGVHPSFEGTTALSQRLSVLMR